MGQSGAKVNTSVLHNLCLNLSVHVANIEDFLILCYTPIIALYSGKQMLLQLFVFVWRFDYMYAKIQILYVTKYIFCYFQTLNCRPSTMLIKARRTPQYLLSLQHHSMIC